MSFRDIYHCVSNIKVFLNNYCYVKSLKFMLKIRCNNTYDLYCINLPPPLPCPVILLAHIIWYVTHSVHGTQRGRRRRTKLV